jgi:hypothetical protein
MAAIQEGVDLQKTVADYIVKWITDHTQLDVGFWSGSVTNPPPQPKRQSMQRERYNKEQLDKIKASIKSAFDSLFKAILDLLQEYKGFVAIDQSTITLNCLSDAMPVQRRFGKNCLRRPKRRSTNRRTTAKKRESSSSNLTSTLWFPGRTFSPCPSGRRWA